MKNSHKNAYIIAIINQKGGVGKTTTTLNLGAALVKLDQKVLVIDADTQANLTIASGLSKNSVEGSLFNLLSYTLMGEILEKEKFIKKSAQGFDIISSNKLLSGIISELQEPNILLKGIDNIKEYYDYILIDCMPAIGAMTINSVYAADGVIIPLLADSFSAEGFFEIVSTVAKIKHEIKENTFLGILWNNYNSKLNNAKTIKALIENVKNKFSFNIPEFKEEIHNTVLIQEAISSKVSIFNLETRRAAQLKTIQNKYLELAKEVISKTK